MQPERLYHIYNHANGSEDLFRSDKNYAYFLERWSSYAEPVADSLAYCLMPNHFHFLVRIKPESLLTTLAGFQTLQGLNLERKIVLQFSHLFNGYTQAYNNMFGRRGSLFIPRFKRKQIDGNDYISRIVAYIHLNPVRHGFVDHPAKWPYSSYVACLSAGKTRIKRDHVLNWFGGRAAFTKFHLGMLEKESDSQTFNDLKSMMG